MATELERHAVAPKRGGFRDIGPDVRQRHVRAPPGQQLGSGGNSASRGAGNRHAPALD
jgi:hypothetical protein